MKHYIDIQRARFDDEGMSKYNLGRFEVGDRINISTKVDGSNSSFSYEDGTLKAFSRKRELDERETLRGFWNWVQKLNPNEYKDLDGKIAYGEWLCLSGDTIIRKVSGGKNTNYMTLRDMYNFLNHPTPDKCHYDPYQGNSSVVYFLNDQDGQSFDELLSRYEKVCHLKKWTPCRSLTRIITHALNNNYIYQKDERYYLTNEGVKFVNEYQIKNNWWNRYGMPSIFSLYHDKDVILANQIKNIVYTGEKEVYCITTRIGYSIKASADHPFLTPQGYIPLKELKVNDCVAVSSLKKNSRKGRNFGKGTKQLEKEQKEYKLKIGKCEVCGTTRSLDLHHIDGDCHNNDHSNWRVLCRDCHKKAHQGIYYFNEFKYEYMYDNIISIEYVGVEDCYDIEMCGNENCANFVANNFIVHNCKHTIVYDADAYGKFYMFDMYDVVNKKWLPQTEVKAFAEKHGLIYVNTYYDGKFISWEHCMSFLDRPVYGNQLEGIVIKNQDKLDYADDEHNPAYIKIVNAQFKETQLKNHIKKVIDPQNLEEKKLAEEHANEFVTEARVRKEIGKMIDEGILPEDILPKDMGIVASNLPKRIYADIDKEDHDTLIAYGNQYLGKAIGAVAMGYARKIILGDN